MKGILEIKKIGSTEDLRQVMLALDCEVRDLEKNKIAWAVYLNSKSAGVIGLSHLEKDFVSIDKGPFVEQELDRTTRIRLLEKLLETAESYAGKYSNVLYNTIDDSMYPPLLEKGFAIVEDSDTLAEYFTPVYSVSTTRKIVFQRV